jgi:hypothetical protein
MNAIRRITLVLALILLLVVVAGCTPSEIQPSSTTIPMVEPGGSIGDMVLQTGAGESQGPPLWAFCSPAFANPGLNTVDCTIPALPELSIGHGWWAIDEATRDSNWKATQWELSLDGQAIDLISFGTFDGADEEVITKLRSWDVLLTNLEPGAHTLRSVLRISETVNDGFFGDTAAGTYELVVNFTIEAP